MIEVVYYELKLLGDLTLPDIDSDFDRSIVAVIRDPENIDSRYSIQFQTLKCLAILNVLVLNTVPCLLVFSAKSKAVALPPWWHRLIASHDHVDKNHRYLSKERPAPHAHHRPTNCDFFYHCMKKVTHRTTYQRHPIRFNINSSIDQQQQKTQVSESSSMLPHLDSWPSTISFSLIRIPSPLSIITYKIPSLSLFSKVENVDCEIVISFKFFVLTFI